MENKVLLFGPDSVWVNVVYGDRLVVEGKEQKVQHEPRPLDEQKFEELSAWQEEARKEERPVETIFEFAGLRC